MKTLTAGSLFSGGIDGMTLGFKMASDLFMPLISIDIENTATKVLKANVDHEVLTADIRDISYKEFLDCNILSITAPCPEYSNARNINSSRNKTTLKEKVHGKELYLHGFRVLALLQPEVFIAENVPEFLNYKIPTECFTELRPYDTYIFQVDTQDFNLPQVRPRVIFVGFKNKWPYKDGPNPLKHQLYNKQLTIKDIRENNPDIHIPNYIKNRIEGGYRDLPSVKTDNDLGNTCVAHYAKDQSTTMIMDDKGYKGLRPLTVREYARLQGIPDNYDLSSVGRTTRYKLIGDSVSPVVCRGFGLEIIKYFEGIS